MYSRLTLNLDSAKKRYEMLEGRQHVVVPAAILAEGVWTGSGGPVLYRNDQLQKTIRQWNHQPLVVYHPTKDNQPISACSPAVLNARKVGITLGAKHDDKSRVECWFDVERTRSVDNRILSNIETGQPIEVSTGLELDLKGEEGEWNGTKYIGEAVNHRPDHLAILPDQKGAYSVASGGGIYANAMTDEDFAVYNRSFTAEQRKKLSKSGAAMKDGSFPIATEEDLKNAIRAIGRAKNRAATMAHIKRRAKALGLTKLLPAEWTHNAGKIKGLDKLPESTQSVLLRSLQNGARLLTNELSFSDISCQLCDLLAAKFGEPGQYWQGYVCDVYETYLVFRDKDKLQMIGYKVENDSVSLDGEAQEVERVTEYRVVNGGPTYQWAGGQLTLKERETQMAGNFDKKAHLAGLIGNGFDESDRAWLEKLEDSALQKIHPKPKVTANTETKTEQPKKFFVQNADGSYTEAALQPTQAKQQSLAELVANSNDPAVKYQFDMMQQNFKASRDSLIANILGNPNNKFTKEWLEAQTDIQLLQGIAAAGGPPASQTQNQQPAMLQPLFMGNAGGYYAQNTEVPKETLVPIDSKFNSVLKK